MPQDKSGLTGWAGIEDHLFTYDEGKTRGYSDDIDMLLVFVSLKLSLFAHVLALANGS